MRQELQAIKKETNQYKGDKSYSCFKCMHSLRLYIQYPPNGKLRYYDPDVEKLQTCQFISSKPLQALQH
jgi:hypothetical protein